MATIRILAADKRHVQALVVPPPPKLPGFMAKVFPKFAKEVEAYNTSVQDWSHRVQHVLEQNFTALRNELRDGTTSNESTGGNPIVGVSVVSGTPGVNGVVGPAGPPGPPGDSSGGLDAALLLMGG